MGNATGTLIAAVAAFTLSSGAHAQGDNTLVSPSSNLPVKATGEYSTPAPKSESGSGSLKLGQPSSANISPALPAYGVNNTLATPSTKSPVAK
jgi:hypothetical protein